MPNYKVVDSDKLDADLARIANVIRKKSGTTINLDFPDMYIRILENLWTRIPYSEGLSYGLNSAGTEYSVRDLGTCTDTDIIIPPIYEGLPVTGIREWAFSSKTNLTSVTIPGSLKSMGKAPFYCCTSLESVTIRDGATCIGTHAFFDCKSLTSVIIPDSVTSIGNNAFYGCSALTSITFPRYLTSIDAYTCYQCSSLVDVIIPDSVTSIGTHAFARCSSLANVTIGNGVTSIGIQAFWQCAGLASVTSLSSTPPMAQAGFLANCPELEKIFVPAGCGAAYKSATNWSNYASIIEEVTA